MVTVFNDHLADPEAVVERLRPFDIVCVMRERTPMTGAIIERLPRLRLIASTATRNASIDLEAAEARGIQVVHTGYTSAPTIELTWALILGSARNLVAENASLRGGGWQQWVGDDMAGRGRSACLVSATSAAQWRRSATLSE
jgi:phosphoglycerate dehydrogenase-like enzyme